MQPHQVSQTDLLDLAGNSTHIQEGREDYQVQSDRPSYNMHPVSKCDGETHQTLYSCRSPYLDHTSAD